MANFRCVACGADRGTVLLAPGEIEAAERYLRRFYACRIRDGASVEDRVDFTQGGGVSVLRCDACGTLTRQPRPNPSELRALYERDNYDEAALEALAANQETFHRARAGRLRTLLPSGSRVLEVGAFVGGFLNIAGEIG